MSDSQYGWFVTVESIDQGRKVSRTYAVAHGDKEAARAAAVGALGCADLPMKIELSFPESFADHLNIEVGDVKQVSAVKTTRYQS